MKRISLLFAALAALALPGAGEEGGLRQAVDAVSGLNAYEYCRELAGDAFAGRLSGSPGYEAAARWAAARFAAWGLQAPDGGYLQEFSSPCSEIEAATMTLTAKNGETTKLEAGKDFLPLLFSDSGQAGGEAVFVGWGISAPELGYDDYAGIDVRGRFAVCFRGTPDPGQKGFQRHDEHRTRMAVAQRRGARGLIYIYPEVQANPNGDLQEKFFPAEISEAVADRILEPLRLKAAELKKDLLAYRVPISFPLGVRVDLEVKARHFAAARGFNVVALLPGSDPGLRGEWLVLGAHLDGCGRHLGILFPGADDNASGSALVLEVARALAVAPARPKRTLAFVLFGGEEMGLLGSSHFAAHLPAGCGKISAMFNFDMQGAGDRAFVSVTPEPAALRAAIEAADRDAGLVAGTREIRQVGVRSSDHAPFFLMGVPCAAFYSNGPHLGYHQAGDSIFRINPAILEAIARLALASAWNWADR